MKRNANASVVQHLVSVFFLHNCMPFNYISLLLVMLCVVYTDFNG